MPNPVAPITDHWFDATHIAYGVVTGSLYGKQWKAEASVFNGREPDENRTNFDFGGLDSWSGRVWFLPTNRWALQVSAGHLTEAEADHDGGARVDVDRVTASATYHRIVRQNSIWASTIAWGRNHEPGNDATNAFLAETNLTLDERDTWFGRFELSGKSGHDLAIETPRSLPSRNSKAATRATLTLGTVWSRESVAHCRRASFRNPSRPFTAVASTWVSPSS
jgi:hypothetical protein